MPSRRTSRGLRTHSILRSVVRIVVLWCIVSAASAETVQLIVDIGRSVQRRSQQTDTLRVIQVPASQVHSAIAALQSDPDIARVEVDGRVFPNAFDDPLWSWQWSLSDSAANPSGTDLSNAWLPAYAKARITVAVVDTGLLLDHIDIDYTLPGYDFVNDTSTANDGDGRDDNPSDPGDWVSSLDIANSVVADTCAVQPSTWHGTGVTGILAARRNNGTGITGAAQNIDIVPVRVMGKCGGKVSDLIAGIRWAAGLEVFGVPDNPNPAQVINLSLGIDRACTPMLQSAINDAKAAGAMVIVAAGNNTADLDLDPQAPASCDGVFTVAASQRDGSLSSYSNFGSDVDLMAPGGEPNEGVYSTEDSGIREPLNDSDYGPRYGTSVATPHVSATAAMMLAVNPLLSDDAIATILQSTSNPFPSDCAGCGAGLLNSSAAVRAAAGLISFDQYTPAASSSSSGSGGLSPWVSLSLLLYAGIAVMQGRRAALRQV